MQVRTDKLDRISSGESGIGGLLGQTAAGAGKQAAEGGSPVKGALKGATSGIKDKLKGAVPGIGGGGGGGGKATKATNFVDAIDVGVPVSVAYNQWTTYDQWPDFMKKVESAEQKDDEPTVDMKAQVFWSHRSWTATIKEQVPDELIVWRSKGQKGHIDGCVSFHELAPRLTRVLVTMEYYPQGLFERTGNIWKAQNRRARLEMKHFRRHVMMNTVLDPDQVEGWRGEIHDEEVTRTHDEVVEQEQQDDSSYADMQDDAGPGEGDSDAEEEPSGGGDEVDDGTGEDTESDEDEADEDDERPAEDQEPAPDDDGTEEDTESDEYDEPPAEDEEPAADDE